jgi:flavodoxin
MKSFVVYYSKTGNTKAVADAVAKRLNAESINLNCTKKGLKRRDRFLEEETLWSRAIERAAEADLVIAGTPTEFRRPHPAIAKFLKQAAIRKTGLFCTCYGMPGATLFDMEVIARKRGIPISGFLKVRTGTEKYRLRTNVSEYKDKVDEAVLERAAQFARKCIQAVEYPGFRMKGVCGLDCSTCSTFARGECKGASFACWSGSGCKVFDCAVIGKSLVSCLACKSLPDCRLIKSLKEQG